MPTNLAELPSCTEHNLGIRSPAHHVVARRMKSQAFGIATLGRHHKHVVVAIAGTRKSNFFAIGAVNGRTFVGFVNGESGSFSAAGRHRPDVALEGKRNLRTIVVDCWMTQQKIGLA